MGGAGDENAAGEMADLLGRLETIAHDAQAAIVVAHHFAKGIAAGKSAIDRASGSGVVARDGDVILTLTPHEEEDCFSLEFVQRDHAPIAPFVLRWSYPAFEADTTLDPEDLRKTGTHKKPDVTPDDILAAVTATPQTREIIVSAVMKATGRGQKAVEVAFVSTIPQLKVERLPRPGTNPLQRYSRNGS